MVKPALSNDWSRNFHQRHSEEPSNDLVVTKLAGGTKSIFKTVTQKQIDNKKRSKSRQSKLSCWYHWKFYVESA